MRDANLVATTSGFVLQLGGKTSEARKRFTIAHEIGHTLFYKDAWHAVGVLTKDELKAEEQICDLFAQALLMPLQAVKPVLKDMHPESPWAILQRIETAAHRMRVSVPALISRLGRVNASCPFPLIIIYLRQFANALTHKMPIVRVEVCSSIGSADIIRTWWNKSASGINLQSATRLFEAWKQRIGTEGEPDGGRYLLVDSCLQVARREKAVWSREEVVVDQRKNGKWSRKAVAMDTLSCLYAAKGWNAELAYVVSLLKPIGNKSSGVSLS